MEFGGIKEVCLTGQFLNLSSLLTCAVHCMKKKIVVIFLMGNLEEHLKAERNNDLEFVLLLS